VIKHSSHPFGNGLINCLLPVGDKHFGLKSEGLLYLFVAVCCGVTVVVQIRYIKESKSNPKQTTTKCNSKNENKILVRKGGQLQTLCALVATR